MDRSAAASTLSQPKTGVRAPEIGRIPGASWGRTELRIVSVSAFTPAGLSGYGSRAWDCQLLPRQRRLILKEPAERPAATQSFASEKINDNVRRKPVTEIKGHINPMRRPGELGIHSVDHFHFVVPDLKAAQHFYSEFGLDVAENGNRLTLRTGGGPHVWGMLGEGARKKHQYVSFGAFEDDLDRFSKRLQEMAVPRVDPPTGVDSNGLWFHDHDGNLVEIAVKPKTSPSEKSKFTAISAGPGERGAPFRSTMKRTYPRRLAHILMFTTDVAKAIQFYTRVLGLRLSDHSGDNIAFLHGIHGSDHHMIAFARSNAPGTHHFSWDVGSVDEIGAGAMHMLGKGYDRGWGLGRHVLGSNLFHYVRDPWGSYSEYSADIDFVPVDCDWKAQDNPPEDSFYAWGPNVPDDFVHNYEA